MVTVPTWQNINIEIPEAGKRVMLLNSQNLSFYPKFGRLSQDKKQWRMMPERLNASFETYDTWAYTGQ